MKLNVLVAEDDPIAGHILMKMLESMDYEPMLVEDGQQALEWYRHNPCNIVLSDFMMPGLNGVDLCREIRALRLPIYTYFILLTAKISQSEGSKVLACGVDAFLPKPMIRSQLQSKLNVARHIIHNTPDLSTP